MLQNIDLSSNSQSEVIGGVRVAMRMHRYTLAQKQLILKHQDQNGLTNVSIANQVKVSEKCIRDWRKSLALTSNSTKKKTQHKGKASLGHNFEDDLIEDILRVGENGVMVTVDLVRQMILEYDNHFLDNDKVKIDCWVYRLVKRKELSFRVPTNISQKKLSIEECQDFVAAINEKKQEYQNPEKFIINMDETPVFFDTMPKKCITKKGAKTVSVRGNSNGKFRVSVLLAVIQGGQKLKPMVVFKAEAGKTLERKILKDKEFPQDLEYACQKNAWCDEEVMRKWIEKIYMPYVLNGRGSEFAHLLLDDFSAHKVRSVQRAIKGTGSFINFLPGGSTSQIQPVDVGINKPFKSNIRNLWNEFMVSQQPSLNQTPQSAPKDNGPTTDERRLLIAKWISQSWRDITAQTVKNSWESCGYFLEKELI